MNSSVSLPFRSTPLPKPKYKYFFCITSFVRFRFRHNFEFYFFGFFGHLFLGYSSRRLSFKTMLVVDDERRRANVRWPSRKQPWRKKCPGLHGNTPEIRLRLPRRLGFYPFSEKKLIFDPILANTQSLIKYSHPKSNSRIKLTLNPIPSRKDYRINDQYSISLQNPPESN